LSSPASRVVVGLLYVCDSMTLPLASQQRVIEGKKKRVVGVAANMYQTRGLKAGASFDKLYEFKERQNEVLGQAIELQDGSKYVNVGPKHWEAEAAICLRQDQPLPATIRALILDVEMESAPR
jgi:hypothetical protein